MTLTILLALFGSMPTVFGETCDYFDAIEINHYYDNDGGHVFDQIIFWSWDDSRSAFRVEAWRLWKTDRQPEKRLDGRYDILWHDGDILRRVQAKVFWETWTQCDREMEDRSKFPKCERRGLTTQRNEPSESDLVP